MKKFRHITSGRGFIRVYKDTVRAFGDISSAAFYAELSSKEEYYLEHDRLTSDGWFFCTVDDMEDATCLTARQQRPIVKKLEQLGLILCELRGMPSKRFFKILDEDDEILCRLIEDAQFSNISNKDATKSKTLSNKMLDLTQQNVTSYATKCSPNNTNTIIQNNKTNTTKEPVVKNTTTMATSGQGQLFTPKEEPKPVPLMNDQVVELVNKFNENGGRFPSYANIARYYVIMHERIIGPAGGFNGESKVSQMFTIAEILNYDKKQFLKAIPDFLKTWRTLIQIKGYNNFVSLGMIASKKSMSQTKECLELMQKNNSEVGTTTQPVQPEMMHKSGDLF